VEGETGVVIAIEELRKVLSYDPETGRLTWRSDMGNRVKAGGAAGTLGLNGYRQVVARRRRYYAHRVAWALYHGEWPAGQIDHINGIRTDNRIANLRDVTHAENARNKMMVSANTSGRTGVVWHKGAGKWMAQITISYRPIYLGLFAEFEEACAARESAEREHGFHKGHGKR